jgi:hypothetical protein
MVGCEQDFSFGDCIASDDIRWLYGAALFACRLLELLALGELRRRGFTPAALKQMMDTLRDYFRRRLSETLDDAGEVRLLTDGHGLFLRTRQGHVFDLLADPTQPLVTGEGLPLEPVTPRAKARRRPRST